MTSKGISKAISLKTILAIAAFLVSCSNDESKIKPFADKNELTKERAEKGEIVYTDSARITAKVNAPEVVRSTSGEIYTEMPKGLQSVFYDRNQLPNAFLKANYGIRKPMQQSMEVRGNVVVVNRKGDTLTTDKLTWYETQDRLYTDKFVKIKTATELIFGEGFESNQDFSKYKIIKPTGFVSLKK